MDGILTILNGFSDMFLDFTASWAGPHNHTFVLVGAPWRAEDIQLPCTRFDLELVVAVCHIKHRKTVTTTQVVHELIRCRNRLRCSIDCFINTLTIECYTNSVCVFPVCDDQITQKST